MKFIRPVVWVLLTFVQLAPLSAADPPDDSKQLNPKFVIYAAEEDAEFGSSLLTLLRGKGERARIDKASSIQRAIESTADVLILVMPGRELPKLEKSALEALKKRKIVGIGYGAAQLFGEMGLVINGGECAHGVAMPPSLTVTKSELLGEPKNAEPFVALQVEELNTNELDLFAVFLPPQGANAAVVDVIARWTTDRNYAPIVRQGNCVLIGIPTSSTSWTTTYVELISRLCLALHERKLEDFSTARYEVTQPGVYEFNLAKAFSTDAPFEKAFHFKFDRPVRINAQLENTGSESVMMTFMGQDTDRTHWTRQDTSQGETLKITAEISPQDITKLGDLYWSLHVTNFSLGKEGDFKLTITVDEQ